MSRATKCALCILGLILCIGLLLKGSVPQVLSGMWDSAGSMTEPRSGASAVLLQDGRILITGGEGASGALVSAELYGNTGSFSPAAPMDVARSRHISAVLSDGRVLVTGGTTTGGGGTNAAEIYSPASNSWSTITGGMTEARSGHTASLLQDGRVLIAGGESSGVASSTLEVFSPITNTFTFAGVLSAPRKDHAAAVLSDGRVLIAGGSNESAVLASVDIYNPETGSISQTPHLSTLRTGLTATTLLDGKVLLAGGSNGSDDLASAEIYDPAAGTLSPAASALSTPRKGHLAFLLPHNNSVLIVGGTSAGTEVSSVELFIPWTGSFNSTGSPAVARTRATGSPLSFDGLLLLAGGENASGKLSTSEFYGFATVKTDQADYTPGTTTIITGSGWQPGETVTLTLVEVPYLDTHGPFTAVADASGNIYNNQFVPDANDVGIRFYLTASGSVSQAQTTFTDKTNLQSTISFNISPSLVANGGTLSWNATATCADQGSSHCSDGGFTNGGPVQDGYTIEIQQATQTSFNGAITCATVSTSGGTGAVSGTFLAPATAGTYFYRARHTSQDISNNSWLPGNSSTVTIAVNADTTAPTTTATPSPTANGAGWNNSNVTVNLSATDNPGGTGVKSITYSASGAQSIPSTTVTGSSTSFLINVEGQTTVTFFATDNASNVESAKTVVIKLDKTAPTLTFGAASPAANGAGWNKTDVSFPFTTSDNLSGVDSTSTASPLVLTTEGASVTGTVTVTDKAGNSATFTSPAVKIDKTKPTLTFGAASPAANLAGWNNTDVSFSFTASDALSGVASTAPPTSPLVVTAEGDAVTGTVTVTDVAGNSETFTSPALKIDKTPPAITGSRSPAANTNGWNNTNVTASFTCTDSTSGVKTIAASGAASGNSSTSPLNTTVSTEGDNQSVTATCTDNAGNSANNVINAIRVDKTGPTLVFEAASPAANAAGWNKTDVSVSFTASDSLSGVDTTTPSTSPLVLATEGNSVTGTLTVTDKAGNSATFTSPSFKIDKTKPTLTFGAVTPAANAAGWNNTNASFPFTAADALSGVASTNPITAPLVLTAEGATVTGTVTVTDVAGNSETFTSPAVRIDKTAPTITGSRSPAANANGWNKTDVTVSFDCTDGLSGVANSSSLTTLSSEGQNQSVPGTCTDNAGNSTNTSVGSISIDKTKPTLSFGGASPTPNAAGWNNSNVSVVFAPSDNLSGVDFTNPGASPLVLTAEGATVSGTVTVTDKAGNSATFNSASFRIDKTAPTLTFGAPSPAANAAGWNKTDVSFSFTPADSLSGVASTSPASGPLVLTTEGAAVTGTVTVTDVAGNTASFTSPAVKIDKTPPTITITFPSNGGSYPLSAGLPSSYSCNDNISGVAGDACVGPVPNGSPFNADALGPRNFAVTATDVAGNTATATHPYTVTKRATSASIVFGSNPILEGQTSLVTVTVTDTDIGTKSIPSGTVILSSLINSDTFSPLSGSCTLDPSTASCWVSVRALDNILNNGPHPIAGNYSGDNVHFNTSGNAGLIVNNVPPGNILLNLSDSSINENSTPTLSGFFTDPGVLDTHSVLIGWGDGSPDSTILLGAGVTSFNLIPHQYLDDNPSGTALDVYNITVIVTDKDGGGGGSATTVTANNVAPTITSVTAPTAPLPVTNANVTATASFVDVGTQDTHTCAITWDDGQSPTTGTVSEANGSGTCTGTNTFTAASVYSITFTVTDDDTGTVSSTPALVVIYDPNGGFVTGGGWIMSPQGAYMLNEDTRKLTGKANFGFVSKYQKGSTVPTGQTEFQFQLGGFNFHSEVYQYLVISGAKAQYKGTGTVNGSGNYGFLLTATDGQLSGGGGIDKFRIKIWDINNGGAIVYDNVSTNTSDDINLINPQQISGGSIVIHK